MADRVGVSPLTAAVYPSRFLPAKLVENMVRVFESHHASQEVGSLSPCSLRSLRTGWDSNPRETYASNTLARCRLRPLGHLSKESLYYCIWSLFSICWENGEKYPILAKQGWVAEWLKATVY